MLMNCSCSVFEIQRRQAQRGFNSLPPGVEQALNFFFAGHDGVVSGWLAVTYTFEKKGLVERDDFTAGSHVMISVKGEPTPPAKEFAQDLMVRGWRRA